MKCRTQDAVASVFLIVALSAPTLAAAQEGPPDLPTVAQAVRHDTSPPLRDLVSLPPQRAIANRQIRLGSGVVETAIHWCPSLLPMANWLKTQRSAR